MFKKMLMVGLFALVTCVFCTNARAEGWKFPTTICGDTIYVAGTNDFAVGAGVQLATFKDGLFEIRTEYVVPVSADDSNQMLGIGAGVNIVKLLSRCGATWVPTYIDSSIGLLGLLEVGANAPRVKAGAYLSVIKIQF